MQAKTALRRCLARQIQLFRKALVSIYEAMSITSIHIFSSGIKKRTQRRIDDRMGESFDLDFSEILNDDPERTSNEWGYLDTSKIDFETL